jgi:hypothetical protein
MPAGSPTTAPREGKEVLLDCRGPVEATLQEILGGVRSACTYVGAHRSRTLQAHHLRPRRAATQQRLRPIVKFMHRSCCASSCCITLLLALGACGKPKEAALPSGTRVLALGDSLTAPHGVRPGAGWPTLLAAKTGWQ